MKVDLLFCLSGGWTCRWSLVTASGWAAVIDGKLSQIGVQF
jgi:hypothetical protein